MTAFIWVLASEHFHRWMIPPIIIVFAIILGLTIGVAGWIAIVVPELWVKPPTDERVTTLRGLISHPKAASIGGATAALFAVAGVALHLLDLYAVWRF
jgi:hypothetical protein